LVELVTAFIEGALDAETERRVIDHLATCDSCEEYLDQFRHTICTLGEMSDETMSDQTLSADIRAALLRALRS
jgi:anti-sigma factor RsiW